MLSFFNKKKKEPDYRYEKFWGSYKKFLNNFYCSNIQYPNLVNKWSIQLNIFKNKLQYYDICLLIDNIVNEFTVNIITSFNIEYYNIQKTYINKWLNIKKKEISNIDDFSFINNKTNKLFFIDLFDCCYKNIHTNRIELYNFFSDYNKFDNNINNNNYRPIFCLACKLNNHQIIELLIKTINIKHICKTNFDLDIDDNITSKKLLDILSFINLYEI
jgi:hypothetical protein